MNEKGIVSDKQRSVECEEKGGKIRKNTGQKTHNGNNLAKQNDAKCPILCSCLWPKTIWGTRKCVRFAGIKALKNARIACGKMLFCQWMRKESKADEMYTGWHKCMLCQQDICIVFCPMSFLRHVWDVLILSLLFYKSNSVWLMAGSKNSTQKSISFLLFSSLLSFCFYLASFAYSFSRIVHYAPSIVNEICSAKS